jgi:FecR protein
MTRIKIALALPGLWLSTSALAGVPNWTMSESSGPVTVASSGLVRVATRGATLTAGDVVSTGAKGRAVIVRGQEYLVVAPNSRIRVADPARSGGMTQIVEQIGNVIFKIKKMATPHFAVETPFLAAVVKGTTFSVTVTESGASVQVVEGRVEVQTRDGGARYLVLPGDIGSVSARALGRLNVQGRETHTIVSPGDGSQAAAPTAEILQADPVAGADAPAEPVIAQAISEPPVGLGVATDNMVTGALVAMAATIPPRQSVIVEPNLETDTIVALPPVPVASATNGGTGNGGTGSAVVTVSGGNGNPVSGNNGTGSSTPGSGNNSSGSGSGNSGPGSGNAGSNNGNSANGVSGGNNGNGVNGAAGGNNGNGANGAGGHNNGNQTDDDSKHGGKNHAP